MISIIIPVFNQYETTLECVQGIRENTKDCEIIIIDNGSIPSYDTNNRIFVNARELDKIPIHFIQNVNNLGFPVAINQGIKAASGDTIILLNNDCIVTPNALNRLETWLHDFDIVGPMTNYCMGLQRVVIPTYQNEQELYEQATQWSKTHAGQSQEVRWIIGFCMAFKKSLYDDVGPFYESLWPCSGEEVDFCLRAKKKGYKVGIAKDVYIHHEGSQTFKSMDVDYNAICDRNDKHLRDKWGDLSQNVSLIPEGGLKLNLGCGYRKTEGYIDIDNRKEVEPDLICDVIPHMTNIQTSGLPKQVKKGGLPYPDNTVDVIRAYDFLEHVPIGSVIPVMEEIYRVLKPNGIFESFTPSTDGRGAFQDPTHVSFWNRNSWSYYSDPECRKLYGIKANFEYATIKDIVTDQENKIIHTHVIARAVKE